MYCKICGRFITYKMTWENLFKSPEYNLCDECFLKYPINIGCEDVVFSNFTFRWFHLFKKEYDISYYPFLNELSRLFSFITKKFKGIILFFEYFPSENILHEISFFDEMVVVLTVFG